RRAYDRRSCGTRAAEGPAIVLRARSDESGKALAKRRRRPEADLGGDVLDRERARLEQVLRAPDATAYDPSCGRRAGLLPETAAQAARAHRRLARDLPERQGLAVVR